MRISRCVAVAAAAMATGLAAAQFYSPPSRDITPSTSRIPAQAPSGIKVDQKLGTVISPDWIFTDQDGKTTTTGELFSGRPSLLLLVFYKCTGVCSTEIESVKKLIRAFKKDNAGELYNLTIVSIDPTETPEMAQAKRQEVIQAYNRPGTDKGLRFLVGDAKNIDGLADEVGFRFYRDPANNRITHPAALMVVSPKRRITRYFINDEFEAKPTLLALKDARDEKIGERDDRPFFLACVNVDPLTGQRSLNILNVVRTGGVITVLTIIGWIFGMNRQAKKQMKNAFEQQEGEN